VNAGLRRIALAAAIASALVCPSEIACAQGAFYRASEAEIAGQPGTIIREEPIRGAPAGGAAHRVLYRSTAPDGRPIAVSGVVILPAGAMPQGGWPIVAWAHPTTGIVPACAPSLAIFLFQQIAGSRQLLKAGYAIAATDYPGLGTAPPHPYLVGDSEARAMIDSVRAARAFPGMSNSNRYVAWGHSQGGQAALFAGMISKSYAPELELIGVAAAAPATDLTTLMTDDLNTTGGRNLTAMTVWSWSRVYDAPLASVIAPVVMPVVDLLAKECIESPFDILQRARTAAPLAKEFLIVKNPADVEPWKSLLARNTPGRLPSTIPLFLAQGSGDHLVRPQVTHEYMKRLCESGSKVRMLVMPDVSHGMAGHDSADAAVAWIADRFAGRPAPSDCKS
jgi:alpha-beta hydrolase superfamily lysophospholipase